MNELSFDALDQLAGSQQPAAVVEKLIAALRERRDYHQMLDALLLKKRLEMGLPLVRPTSFDGVPQARQEEFEESYVAAARQVGELFLADGDIARAWAYFRSIREPEPVARAIDKLEIDSDGSAESEQLIQIALYEGVHPVKGLAMLLKTHGTCNTITAFEQHAGQLGPDDRRNAAALLVDNLYHDLRESVRREIERRSQTAPAEATLSELIAANDWLFDEGNYHIDVSHLHAVVRFARFLKPGDPELAKAQQLAEYGAHLAAQFQYPGDPPFDEYYPAHQKYFQALGDAGREEALQFFRSKIDSLSDPQDQTIAAWIAVDLLMRLDRLEDALELAAKHLRDAEDGQNFSFSQLCCQAGRLDVLKRVLRERGDLVGYAAVLLQNGRGQAT